MSNVIQAEYVDFKNIKTRQCVQIVLEVDIAQADNVFNALGYPSNHTSKYVAIAPLKDISEPFKPEDKKSFNDLNLSQQCALKMNDEVFMIWFHNNISKRSMKDYLDINSRRELDRNGQPALQWKKVMDCYVDHKQRGLIE